MLDPAEIARSAAAAGLTNAAVHLVDLEGGAALAVDDGRDRYPASMVKTPLAVAVAAAERDGRLRWDDRIAIDRANLTVNDAPSPLAEGAVATVAELLDLMLERSDNIATNVLIDAVGRERACADLAALGFPRTAVRRKLSGALPLIDDPAATGRNAHPAADAAALLCRIAVDDVPGAARVHAALERQYWNAKLSSGLAPGDRFAHKTGDTDDVSHDGGILHAADGGRYVLVVYTELPSNDANDRRFGSFARALRPYLARASR